MVLLEGVFPCIMVLLYSVMLVLAAVLSCFWVCDTRDLVERMVSLDEPGFVDLP